MLFSHWVFPQVPIHPINFTMWDFTNLCVTRGNFYKLKTSMDQNLIIKGVIIHFFQFKVFCQQFYTSFFFFFILMIFVPSTPNRDRCEGRTGHLCLHGNQMHQRWVHEWPWPGTQRLPRWDNCPTLAHQVPLHSAGVLPQVSGQWKFVFFSHSSMLGACLDWSNNVIALLFAVSNSIRFKSV